MKLLSSASKKGRVAKISFNCRREMIQALDIFFQNNLFSNRLRLHSDLELKTGWRDKSEKFAFFLSSLLIAFFNALLAAFVLPFNGNDPSILIFSVFFSRYDLLDSRRFGRVVIPPSLAPVISFCLVSLS